jgi:adenosine deaminase
VKTLPKVLLHDHLDGGLRVETVLDLAETAGYSSLPATDVAVLADWFDQSRSGSLATYLEAFTHTIGVMQTSDALARVAYEAVVDNAADGVVYAEFRFAPFAHLEEGLDPQSVVDATLSGLADGARETGMTTGLILVALRQLPRSADVARLAVDFSHRGVVGFDLAGPERGFPADHHVVACRTVREANLGLTVHAGEADGPHSIWSAVQRCAAHRIGHGVHIIDDCVVEHGRVVKLGPLATYVRDFRVPLEVSPTSNLHTGGWSPETHPVGSLHRAGFNVTLNTDNRLMSRTTLSDEFRLAVEHQNFTEVDLLQVTRQALMAAFAPLPVKRELLEDRIEPGYA